MTNVLLAGVVGSTAYGLAHEGSDIHRIGVYAESTEKILGLGTVRESIVSTNPDTTYHEAKKYCKLALGCNPGLLELLWLPGNLITIDTQLGIDLLDIRESFLSAHRVRVAYLGYATHQFRKLENRGDGSFSSNTRKRTAKHARHLFRLLHQGYGLYTTGYLDIRLRNPQKFVRFGEEVAHGNIAKARKTIALFEEAFNTTHSPLPVDPDISTVNDWLLNVRKNYP
jgi:uncharacterized protein